MSNYFQVRLLDGQIIYLGRSKRFTKEELEKYLSKHHGIYQEDIELWISSGELQKSQLSKKGLQYWIILCNEDNSNSEPLLPQDSHTSCQLAELKAPARQFKSATPETHQYLGKLSKISEVQNFLKGKKPQESVEQELDFLSEYAKFNLILNKIGYELPGIPKNEEFAMFIKPKGDSHQQFLQSQSESRTQSHFSSDWQFEEIENQKNSRIQSQIIPSASKQTDSEIRQGPSSLSNTFKEEVIQAPPNSRTVSNNQAVPHEVENILPKNPSFSNPSQAKPSESSGQLWYQDAIATVKDISERQANSGIKKSSSATTEQPKSNERAYTPYDLPHQSSAPAPQMIQVQNSQETSFQSKPKESLAATKPTYKVLTMLKQQLKQNPVQNIKINENIEFNPEQYQILNKLMETSTMDENKCREALIKCNFDEDLALESLL